MHTAAGHHLLYYQQFTPRLLQVLKGIQKTQVAFKAPRIRLPITLNILSDMFTILQCQPTSHNNLMIWVASCIAFFGFLRSSELTVPSQDTYDPSIHLSVNDVAVDNRSSPTMIQVTIKQSKTDPFRQGVKLFLGKTEASVCPVTALLPYMSLQGNTPGPLFVLEDGHYLTRSLFGDFLNNLLDKLHLTKDHFNTHSFQIGAASSARAANIPDHQIQMLGRWRSDAYKLYIRTSPTDRANLSKVLAAGSQ